jgi:hypothetical protein
MAFQSTHGRGSRKGQNHALANGTGGSKLVWFYRSRLFVKNHTRFGADYHAGPNKTSSELSGGYRAWAASQIVRKPPSEHAACHEAMQNGIGPTGVSTAHSDTYRKSEQPGQTRCWELIQIGKADCPLYVRCCTFWRASRVLRQSAQTD